MVRGFECWSHQRNGGLVWLSLWAGLKDGVYEFLFLKLNSAKLCHGYLLTEANTVEEILVTVGRYSSPPFLFFLHLTQPIISHQILNIILTLISFKEVLKFYL